MNCTGCGTLLPPEAKFCVQCGAKVEISGSTVGSIVPVTPAPAKGPKSPNSTTVLVLGILGLVMCQPLGLVAWIMGRSEQKKYPDDENVKIGKVLGIVSSVFFFISLGIILLSFVIIIIAAIYEGFSPTDSLGGNFFD